MNPGNKIPEEGRSLAHTDKRSAKYRNPKGPSKYFSPYKNRDFIELEEIEASDVNVPVAPLRDALNSQVWTPANRLKPEVRQALIDIANSFYESLDLDLKVKDILFTGSLANYGWTEGSDIDLHLMIDYGDLSDISFLEDYLYLKKENWLDKHDITIYGFEVEPFAKDEEGEYAYKAIYSINNDEWIVPPRKDKPEIDFETVKEKAAGIMDKIDRIVSIEDDDKRFREAENLKNKLGGIRQIGLSKEGEYSNENLIYKTLRRSGYLDRLSDAKHDSFDAQMSLNESIQTEKAKSKAQQRYFAMVKACKEDDDCASKSVKDTADSMKTSDVDDFAKTKHKGLPEKVKEEDVKVMTNLGATPMVHTLRVQSGIDGMTPERVDAVKDFISFVCGKLSMESPVDVSLRRGRDEFIETTASYVPGNNTNHVRCGGRALVDILRSIAHELTHNRQRELGMFKSGEEVQNIGGHIEDQANSVAGIFIKDFTHNYGFDNIYDI